LARISFDLYGGGGARGGFLLREKLTEFKLL